MDFERKRIPDSHDRRAFIGGSDARIIMGDDEAALVRLWREKRGELEPEDLADISRDNLDENGASIWVRRGSRAEG
jgi:predicted phage-related endonuclease